VIRVKDLVATYGDTTVLKGVSLDVQDGETMVIMGQSGCGKTTFLRHVIGLFTPASGSVEVDGRDLTNLSRSEYREFSRSFGMLFQSGALFNSMSVADNVAFPLREHYRLASSIVRLMVRMKLDLVDLPDAGPKMPSELSGGMKKRAGLARALILDPRLLFLDEPTSGLDPVIAAGIDQLINKIKKAFGTTMVVVSHDIESGLRIADRIAIFYQGEIVQVGTPEEIKNSDHPYVHQFMNRKPPTEEQQASGLADSLVNL
jgi:phospholipid/cholesterol/gamma-HCH transport system ATP-binding protein